MTTYRSKPVEIEAMQWDGSTSTIFAGIPRGNGAHEIVAWVNANGGEARYEPHVTSDPYDENDPGERRIALRTINGWTYAKPGDYIAKGDTAFVSHGYTSERGPTEQQIRSFLVVADLSDLPIKHEWEVSS